MDLKSIFGKFLKGAIGGAATILAAQTFVGPINWKLLLAGIGTGAFHAGWEAAKQSIPTS